MPVRVMLPAGDRYDPLASRLAESAGDIGIGLAGIRQFPLAEAMPQLQAALTGPAPPDVLVAPGPYVPALAERLLALDDRLSPAELAEFDPAALEQCRWEGRLVALPLSSETRLLFYRADIFDDRREQAWFREASGGHELRVPQSWDELAAVAQHFTRSGRLTGYAYPGREFGLVGTFAEIVSSVGGQCWDSDGQPRFFSRAGEWALSLLRDLFQKWGAVPPETPDCGLDDISEAFRQGRCAMVADSPSTARLLCDTSVSAVAGWHSVALLPAGPGSRRAAWSWRQTVAIRADTADADESETLLRWISGAETQLFQARDGQLPTREAVRASLLEELRPGTLAHLRLTLAQRTLELGTWSPPRITAWPRIESEVWPILQQGITGEREVVDALEAAQARSLDVTAH